MPANATYRVSGYCRGGRDQAGVLIFNGETAVKRTFVVQNFYLREAQPTSPAPTLWNLHKTTAQSEGDAVPAIPLDSSSSDLPSQVQIATNALVTAGAYLYGRWLWPITTAGVAAPAFGGGTPTSSIRSDYGTIFDSRGFSDVQALTLREGEGLAFINPSASDTPFPALWQLLAQIRVGSSVYSINTTLVPYCNYSGFSIFNGTGSGVVIEVLSFQLMNVALTSTATTIQDAPVLRLARIYGGFEGGVPLTPVSLGGAPVPSQLQVTRHQDWKGLNVATNLLDSANGIGLADLGVPGTTILSLTQQRQIGVFRHFLGYIGNLFNLTGSTNAVLGTSFAHAKWNGMSFAGGVNDISRIRLNPGEGLALIIDNNTNYASYWFEAEITHEPPQVSGTSPMGYSS